MSDEEHKLEAPHYAVFSCLLLPSSFLGPNILYHPVLKHPQSFDCRPSLTPGKKIEK
jgi:hypothetical protein